MKFVVLVFWIWMIFEDGMLYYCVGIKRRFGDMILIMKEVIGVSGYYYLLFMWLKLIFVLILYSLLWKYYRFFL